MQLKTRNTVPLVSSKELSTSISAYSISCVFTQITQNEFTLFNFVL